MATNIVNGTTNIVYTPYQTIIPSTWLNQVNSISNSFLSVYNYGAVGNGTTDDTAAIQLAENTAASLGMNLYFPPGTYLINNTGITKATGVSWLGAGKKVSVLKAASGSFTTAMISGTAISNVSIAHLGFDFTAPTFVTFMRNMYFTTFTNSSIQYCDFLQQAIGFQADGGKNFHICDNTFTQSTAYGTTINEAIWITANTSAPSDYIVSRNIINNVGTDFSGTNITVTDNQIYNWAYGAGITTEQNYFNAVITGNQCIGGTGLDANNVPPIGIECWHNQSTISHNICSYNAGMGISVGGAESTVVGNVCLNNGVYSGGSAPARYRTGIIIRYVSSNINAGSSLVSNNICVDTGTGTQQWGITDDGSSVGGVTLTDNLCIGASGTAINVSGTRYSFRGPQLEQTITGQAGFTIPNGGYGFGNSSISFSGAQLGDKVTATLNQVMGGVIITAWVPSANNVAYEFYNPTGSSVTIPNFSINFFVEKPLNYVNF